MPSDELEPPGRVETGIKAALRAIPYAGSSLSVIFEDSRARHGARVARFAEDVIEDTPVERLKQRMEDDERIEIIFLEGVELAVRSGLAAKRRLLARVVARAADNDDEVETAQLLLQVLRDLDSPHLGALKRICDAGDATAAEVPPDEDGEQQHARVSEAVMAAGANEAAPVRAALVRTGVAHSATLTGGGLEIYRVTDFGRTLLADLEQIGKWH